MTYTVVTGFELLEEFGCLNGKWRRKRKRFWQPV